MHVKAGSIIGWTVDILFLLLVLSTFKVSTVAGIIAVVFWVLVLGLVPPGLIFREMDIAETQRKQPEPKVSPYEGLVGTYADAVSELNPQGLIEAAGKRISAKSSFGYISNGSSVRIIQVLPDSVVVEEV